LNWKVCWENSLAGRACAGLRRYSRYSRLRGFFYDVPVHHRPAVYEHSLVVRLVSRLAAAAAAPLEKAAGAVRRGLPASRVHNARVPGWLSASRLYAALAGVRVETLLWAVVLYVVLDYAFRTLPAASSLAPVWDELLLLVIAALWPVQMALRGRLAYRRTQVDMPVFIFIGVSLVLFFLRSPDTGLAMEGLRVYLQYVLWFFVGSNLLLNLAQCRALVRGMVAVAALIAAHGVYQYIIGVEMPAGWVDAAEAGVRTRVYSIIGSPNVLGSFLVLFIPVTLSQFLSSSRRGTRYLYLACLALMAFCLVVTYSRGAWAALAGALLVYSLLYNWRMLAALAAGAALAPQIFPGIVSRLTYLLSPAYLASSQRAGRLARWQVALDKVRDNPLAGEGFGRFGGAVAARHIPGSFYVDNFYLKTAVEAGLLGLAALLWLLLSVVRCGLSAAARLRDGYLKLLAVGILSGLVGVMLHNGVENIFEVPMMCTYFWLLAGFLAALPFIDPAAGE